MQDTLKVAIIQSDLIWENPAENRRDFSKKIKEINQEVDLILLPEMFTSGFTMTPEQVAEPMNGETVNWMRNIAQEKDVALGGSVVIEENQTYYNRFIFAHPDSEVSTYDKRHTFTLAGEDKVYASGNKKVLVEYKGWKICLMICYDLRFPVWSRNTEDYDLLLYVANWPKPRVNAWDALLKARAIENMCYCIGVNRTGGDANGHEYVGHSAVYNSLGESLCKITDGKQETRIVELDKNHLETTRATLKFLDDRDSFTVI